MRASHLALLLFLGISPIYVAIARGVFLYGDDMLVFQVTEGIVERGSFAVTSPVAATVDDPGFAAGAIPGDDGRGYAKYGIGQSLATIPFYVLADLVLEPVLPIDERADAFGNRHMGPVIYGTSLLNPVVSGATDSARPDGFARDRS